MKKPSNKESAYIQINESNESIEVPSNIDDKMNERIKLSKLVKEKEIPYPPEGFKIIGDLHKIEENFFLIENDDFDDKIVNYFEDNDERYFLSNNKNNLIKERPEIIEIENEIIKENEKYRINEEKIFKKSSNVCIAQEPNDFMLFIDDTDELEKLRKEVKEEKISLLIEYEKLYKVYTKYQIDFESFYNQYRQVEKFFMYLDFKKRVQMFLLIKRRQINKRIFSKFLIKNNYKDYSPVQIDNDEISRIDNEFILRKRQRNKDLNKEIDELNKENEELNEEIKILNSKFKKSKRRLEIYERIMLNVYDETKDFEKKEKHLNKIINEKDNEIAKLKKELETLKKDKKNEENYECSICLFSYGDKIGNVLVKPVSVVPCGHIFCENCTADFIRRDPRCPICKRNITRYHIIHF